MCNLDISQVYTVCWDVVGELRGGDVIVDGCGELWQFGLWLVVVVVVGIVQV